MEFNTQAMEALAEIMVQEMQRVGLEILQTKVMVSNGIAVITCQLGGKPFEYDASGLFTPINYQSKLLQYGSKRSGQQD